MRGGGGLKGSCRNALTTGRRGPSNKGIQRAKKRQICGDTAQLANATISRGEPTLYSLTADSMKIL